MGVALETDWGKDFCVDSGFKFQVFGQGQEKKRFPHSVWRKKSFFFPLSTTIMALFMCFYTVGRTRRKVRFFVISTREASKKYWTDTVYGNPLFYCLGLILLHISNGHKLPGSQ